MSKEAVNETSNQESMSSPTVLSTNRGQIIVVLVLFAIAGSIIAGAWLRNRQSSSELKTKNDEASEHEREDEHHSTRVILDEEQQAELGLAVEAAQLRTTSGSLLITGVVGSNETRVAHIRPLSRGRIEKVYVRAGDRVRAGQPLVAYDNIELGELVSEYAAAKATLEKANADAEVSKRSFERAQKLIEVGVVADAEYEKQAAEYKTALASIRMQESQVSMVEQKMRRFGMTDTEIHKLETRDVRQLDPPHTILRAPFNGFVMGSEVAPGEAIDTERELFTIADLATVWVQGDVHEKEIAAIRPGRPVAVTVSSYPGKAFAGRITYLSDVLDPQTRTAKVRCEVSNLQGLLKLEMFATIQVPTGVQVKTLMIPASAIQEVENRSVVFVKVERNQFEKREVRPGTRSDGWVEILDGLEVGEAVVSARAFMLKSHLKKEEFGEHEH